MIWSVSTFSAGSGISLLVKLRKGSAISVGSLGSAADERPRVAHDTGDGGRRGGQRARRGSVRAPLPWRPSKLRLLVLTMYWPGWPWSPFMAMHMEQPDSRHSAPAALKMSVQALALGLGLHLLAAGHDHQADAAGDLAAVEDGGGLAQVADAAVGAASR